MRVPRAKRTFLNYGHLIVCLLILQATVCRADLRDDALAAAKKATTYYWKEVST